MVRILNFFAFVSIILFTSGYTFAQFPGCPSVDAGVDQNLNCSTPCATLTATPFNAGATTQYSVAGIPHNPPIAYDEAGGTGVSVNIDDRWSNQISLPFTFCYYGQSYTTCKIGSNGAIKFGTYSPTYHPYAFTESCPDPGLADAGDIFGVYHDIDPSVCGNIKWYLLGTAPCRIFVVSYDYLCHFSCNSLQSRHMMVLYETTNVIDVYVELKETCSSWNDGNAIIGIQSPDGSQGIAAPGRNTTPIWTVTTPEGWRFSPSGTPIYTLEWFQGATSLGSTATINVCPTVPTTYTAVATYTACNGDVIVEQDDVVVSPSTGGVVVSQAANTPASCGQSNGSVTVSASGGSPGYTYSLDNVTYQGSGTFSNLATGTYTIFGKDAVGCVGVIQINIVENTTLTFDFSSVQQVSCYGANDGEAIVVATNGQSPYQYSLNGGTPVSSPTFTNLNPGLNTFTVIDNAGCSITIDSLITEPAELLLNLVSTTDATCGANDGQIEVSAAGGITPYTYQLNGTSSQSTGIFPGVSSGNYVVQVIDGNGCQKSINATINSPASPALVLVSNDPVCIGATNSNLVVSASGGAAPYMYDVNGSNPQASPIFTTLGPGTYTINVTDNVGCTTPLSVEVEALPLPEIFNDTLICGFDLWVTGTLASNGATWSCADTAIHFSPDANALNPQIYTFTQGVYTIQLTDGCNQSVDAVINFPSYVYTDVLDTLVCEGSTIVLNALVNSTTQNFIWNTGQTGPSVTVNAPGDYIVTASNECYSYSETATVSNKICTITAPNVIVLSSTVGNNNFFVNYDGVTEFHCTIINRWGNFIYEYSDPAGHWDGKTDGKNVDEGVYFYLIHAVFESGQETSLHGFVQVLH